MCRALAGAETEMSCWQLPWEQRGWRSFTQGGQDQLPAWHPHPHHHPHPLHRLHRLQSPSPPSSNGKRTHVTVTRVNDPSAAAPIKFKCSAHTKLTHLSLSDTPVLSSENQDLSNSPIKHPAFSPWPCPWPWSPWPWPWSLLTLIHSEWFPLIPSSRQTG